MIPLGVVFCWSNADRLVRALCGCGGWFVFFFDTYVISSCEEQTVDAWASGAEEGRSNLR